jgi:ABC-2 type transport system permease protein/oleandomycin transport system permease protein
MTRVLADTAVMASRNFRRTMRLPEMVVFATIQPVMFVVLFRYVFGGAIDTGDISYVDFLLPGIFVQTIAFGTFGTALGLADDMQKGVIDRFRSLPMRHGTVVVGRIINDMSVNTLSIVVMVLVGLLVGYRPAGSTSELALGFVLMLLISFSLSWINAAQGIRLKTVEAVNSFGFIWMFPLTFVSSAFVPVDTMPSWLQGFAENQPFTRFVDAVRSLSIGSPSSADIWATIAWCVGILVVFVPLSIRLFKSAGSN